MYTLKNRLIPAYMHLKIPGILQAGRGFLPMYPNLWHDTAVFKYHTYVLLLRYNSHLAVKFDENHLRPIVIASEQAFQRVVIEVCWQLCSWLDRFHCEKSL